MQFFFFATITFPNGLLEELHVKRYQPIHMAGTHKKRIERYITFDEESERYRINLSCIRIWILAVLWLLILPPLHHNLLFIERYITNRLCYILYYYSNSEDISLDELEEELEEHKDYDVSQGHWHFSFYILDELLICMLFDIAPMWAR